MTLRFVVLHHTRVLSPHFDLMFEWEADALLTTFRCPGWPLELGDVLEELPEHRRAYLDYEGPISNGRGQVSRVAAGTIKVDEVVADPPTLAIALRSDHGDVVEFTLVHAYGAGDERHTMWTVATIA